MQNKLEAIEAAVYALPMETLDVADNKITAVEPAVSHMSSLTNLFVQVRGKESVTYVTDVVAHVLPH